MEFFVAKQCRLASNPSSDNKFWKLLVMEVVQERSLDVIHWPTYFEL